MIALALSVLSLAVWLMLVFGRGYFWQARETDDFLPPFEDESARTKRVTAIMPARDEAEVIARSVTSLLKQNCGCDFDIVLVDDQSSDGTAEAAYAAARAVGAADRLTILRSENPPPGWTGKINAMRVGLEFVEGRAKADTYPSLRAHRSNPSTAHDPDSGMDCFAALAMTGSSALPDYIWFTDADIEHAPDVLSRLVGGAERDNLVMASLMAQLACESRAERWLVPAFVYFFDMLYPFAWVNKARAKTAAAAGGCMLVRREALARAGGVDAIRNALIDDCALGATMKPVGPIFLGLTHRVKSLRPYPHVADIRRMIVRSAYAQLRYSPLLLGVTALGMAATFIAPPLLAGHPDAATGLIALTAYMLMVLSYRPMLRRYGLKSWRGLFLPIVAGLYMIFTLKSALAWYRGRGGAWKGRYQAEGAIQ